MHMEEEWKNIAVATAQMATEFKMVKETLDVTTQTLRSLSERINVLEMRLAVNDIQTNKHSDWFSKISGASTTILIGCRGEIGAEIMETADVLALVIGGAEILFLWFLFKKK